MDFIQLRDIHKSYQVGEEELPILKGISLSMGQGEYTALMGSSGSGKSTLMNILGCLDRPTSGTYLFEGKDVTHLTSDERATIRNEKIGFIFQSFNLLRRTSALENVIMPLTYARRPIIDAQARDRARELLERVGLGDRIFHEPNQLSGGQQQRVAIARALINSPKILLADEPTGNLDSRTSQEILDMFRELNERDGITILIVTHESNVATHASRVIRLHDGMILEESFHESHMALPPVPPSQDTHS